MQRDGTYQKTFLFEQLTIQGTITRTIAQQQSQNGIASRYHTSWSKMSDDLQQMFRTIMHQEKNSVKKVYKHEHNNDWNNEPLDWTEQLWFLEKNTKLDYLNSLAKSPEEGDKEAPLFKLNGNFSLYILMSGVCPTNMPPVTLVLDFWPSDPLSSTGRLSINSSWWIRTLEKVENVIFNEFSLQPSMLYAILNNSPALRRLTFSIKNFADQYFAVSDLQTFRYLFAKVIQLSFDFLCKDSIDLTFAVAPQLYGISSEAKYNLENLETWTNGNLSTFSLQIDYCWTFYGKSDLFVEMYVMPFLTGNLFTLKHFATLGCYMENKYFKRLMRHHNFSKLKLETLQLEVLLGDTSDVSNYFEVLNFMKSQTRLKELLININAWSHQKQHVKQIFKYCPNLTSACIRKIEPMGISDGGFVIRLRGRSQPMNLNVIFPIFSPNLKTFKMISILPEPAIHDVNELHSLELEFQAIADKEFFEKLPGLECLVLFNVEIPSVECFLPILEKSKKIESLVLKTNLSIIGDDLFKAMVYSFRHLKLLEIHNSRISDRAITVNCRTEEYLALLRKYGNGKATGKEFDSCETLKLSIFFTLRHLRELSLIYCPWITEEGFATIKAAKLTRVNFSRNPGITGTSLRVLVENNPLLEHIIVTRCHKITRLTARNVECTVETSWLRKKFIVEVGELYRTAGSLLSGILSYSVGPFTKPNSHEKATVKSYIRCKFNSISTEDSVYPDERLEIASDLRMMSKRMRIPSLSSELDVTGTAEWTQMGKEQANLVLQEPPFHWLSQMPYRYPLHQWPKCIDVEDDTSSDGSSVAESTEGI